MLSGCFGLDIQRMGKDKKNPIHLLKNLIKKEDANIRQLEISANQHMNLLEDYFMQKYDVFKKISSESKKICSINDMTAVYKYIYQNHFSDADIRQFRDSLFSQISNS